MSPDLEGIKRATFIHQFKKVVGREPTPAEVEAGKDPEGGMMDALLDAKIAEGKAKGE